MPLTKQEEQETTIERARQFAESVEPIIKACEAMAVAFRSIAMYHVPDLQSAKWYEMAGRPYGNNTRGKKRWLREWKRGRNATN